MLFLAEPSFRRYSITKYKQMSLHLLYKQDDAFLYFLKASKQ